MFGTFVVGAAHADEVTLKNGDRLTGTIVKSDAKVLVLKSDFAGDVSIQWDAITSLQSTQPLYLGLKDGQTIVGTVTASDGELVIATKNAGTVTIAAIIRSMPFGVEFSKNSVDVDVNDSQQQETRCEVKYFIVCLTVGGYPAPPWLWPNGFNPGVQSAVDGGEGTGHYTAVVRAIL